VKKSGVTPSKAAREEFKPAAPFKFADDFDWLVPDDYEVNMQCCGSGMIYFGSDPGSGSGFSESSGSDPGSGSGSYSGSGSCINLYESAYLYMHMYTHTHTYTHIHTTVYM